MELEKPPSSQQHRPPFSNAEIVRSTRGDSRKKPIMEAHAARYADPPNDDELVPGAVGSVAPRKLRMQPADPPPPTRQAQSPDRRSIHLLQIDGQVPVPIAGTIMPMAVNASGVRFERAGDYKLAVTVDGQQKGTWSLRTQQMLVVPLCRRPQVRQKGRSLRHGPAAPPVEVWQRDGGTMDGPRPTRELAPSPPGLSHGCPRRPCHVPHRTDTIGIERTTTVTITPSMSWSSPALPA